MKLYQIDAFTSEVFGGNPAAVIKLDAFPDPEFMQQIAMENNLSETAFVIPRGDGHYDLRWFTPTLEIEFCGHATIATAHALYAEYDLSPPFHFHTQVGELIVTVEEDLYIMDAPVFEAKPTDITQGMRQAFPVPVEAAFWASDNLFLVLENASDVTGIKPDMAHVRPLSNHGVGITARGTDPHDCISRFFVPAQGIDEDPVTGSAHAAIGPYWAKRLGQNQLTAFQASERGGTLYLDVGETRMKISGQAVTYMQSELRV